jgi:hypothetical protein
MIFRRGALGISLRGLPPTGGNACRLLIDGKKLDHFRDDSQCTGYVIAQFYIIHDDGLGNELRGFCRLTPRVRCWLLYDTVDQGLTDAYLRVARRWRVRSGFIPNRQLAGTQINFVTIENW